MDLVKRWRWVMVGVIFFDMAITHIGQPSTYWTDPSTVREGNQWFRAVMAQGAWVSLLVDFLYLSGSFWLVSKLPWRLGLALLLGLALGHFFGGSTWICYRYGFGVQGVVIYAILVSGVLAFLAPKELKLERAGE